MTLLSGPAYADGGSCSSLSNYGSSNHRGLHRHVATEGSLSHGSGLHDVPLEAGEAPIGSVRRYPADAGPRQGLLLQSRRECAPPARCERRRAPSDRRRTDSVDTNTPSSNRPSRSGAVPHTLAGPFLVHL